MRPVLVSACLLGLNTRYDGKNSLTENLPLESDEFPVPVCPEQLAGLPTPRNPVEIAAGSGEDVLDGNARVLEIETGADRTENFLRGAQETLKTALILGCNKAVLKSKSPSCGKGSIYRNGKLIPGNGAASAILLRNGIEIISV